MHSTCMGEITLESTVKFSSYPFQMSCTWTKLTLGNEQISYAVILSTFLGEAFSMPFSCQTLFGSLKVCKKVRALSIESIFCLNASIYSFSSNPSSIALSLSRMSAFSARKSKRYSLRDVNMRYGSLAPATIKSSMRVPVRASDLSNTNSGCF